MSDLERWEAKYQARGVFTWAPDPFVAGLDARLPRTGRALDLAGGTGRHALWLAARGLEVTLVDVAPTALRLAEEEAARRGLSVRTVQTDLARDDPPAGPWDVVVCVHYLERRLWGWVAGALAPGGWYVHVQPTRTNLERHPKPGPDYLVASGELAALPGLETVQADEGWNETGRHEGRLAAVRP